MPEEGQLREYLRSVEVCPGGQNIGDEKNPEWEKRRKKLIVSGTTAAKLLPKSHPWHDSKTARDDRKRYLFGYRAPTPQFLQDMFDAGNAGEKKAISILDIDLSFHDLRLEHPGLLEAKENEYWGGSVDGLVIDSNGVAKYVVEIKTCVKRKLQFEEETGLPIVPGYYMAQVQLYMYLTGINRAMFVQYDPKLERERVFTTYVDFDPENFEIMRQYMIAYTEHTLKLREILGLHIEALSAKDDFCQEPVDLLSCRDEPESVIKRVIKRYEADLESLRAIQAIIVEYAPAPAKRASHPKRSRTDPTLVTEEERDMLFENC